MVKKIFSIIVSCVLFICCAVSVFAEDIIFINDDFENMSTDNWWDNTGRGEKSTSGSWYNRYMVLKSNSDSFFNFQAKDVYSTGLLYAEFDIKFTENNMEIQLRESRDVSATGFTMAGRIRKTAYYLEYFSNGNYYKMPEADSDEWFILNDVSKWYTIKIAMDIEQNKYSVYILDKSTQRLLSKIENVDFYGECEYVNYFAFSSENELYIDNVDIRQLDVDNLKISGSIYPSIPRHGTQRYTYNAYSLRDNGTSMDVDDVNWSILIPKTGVSINENTGVLTVTSEASPGPIMICVEKKYQTFLNSTYLIDLER